MRNNRKLRVRVKFIFFYSELVPTDPRCNMLQTLLRLKKYGKVMSDEQLLKHGRYLSSNTINK